MGVSVLLSFYTLRLVASYFMLRKIHLKGQMKVEALDFLFTVIPVLGLLFIVPYYFLNFEMKESIIDRIFFVKK